MKLEPAPAVGDPPTLAHVLSRRALLSPRRTAVVFVDENGREHRRTYEELDRGARAVAQLLQELDVVGAPVILAMPAGVAFVEAFFGCLYARAVAVPVALPRLAKRHDAERKRLVGIIQRTAPGAVFTTETLLPFFETAVEQGYLPLVSNLRAVDELDPSRAARFVVDPPKADDLAMLQFTSGSTSEPRGVCVLHRNIMANVRNLVAHLGQSVEGVFGGWVPHYHDLGLFGLIALPIYAGSPTVLMSPIQFLRDPMSWLRLIHQYRIGVSGGPSFSYERCVRRSKDRDLEGLDLTSWEVAVDAGEAVNADVHRAFAGRFAGAGFLRTAFQPFYGLAEATLMVSGGPVGAGVAVRRVSFEHLSRGRAVDAIGIDRAVELVSCGEPAGDLRIVHSETGRELGDCQVGEIWIRGEQVAPGYLGGGESSRATFRAYLDDEGPFLRTGDLGFLDRGHVFVTGRRKELIVIHGRNFYPTDLETTVAEALRVPLARVAVIESSDAKGVNVIVEGLHRASAASVKDVVGRAIFEAHGVAVRRLERIGAGELPRTSSGKKQRLALRALFPENATTTSRGAR